MIVVVQRGASVPFLGKGCRWAFHKEITYIRTYIKYVCGVLMTKEGTEWVKLRENITTCSELWLTVQY